MAPVSTIYVIFFLLHIITKEGFKFEIVISDFDETLVKNTLPYSEYVQEIAYGKAKTVWEKLKNDEVKPDIIIAMDTMVSCNGAIYGKPKDENDAFNILKQLTNSGVPHLVFTGVVIKHKDIYEKYVEVTTVFMEELTDQEILGYIATGEPMGRAGAYAIQGIAGSFVKSIVGDYNNVIGVPLCSLTNKLKSIINNY